MIYFTAIFMQNKKEKVRVEMVCMNSVLIDLGKAIRSIKNYFQKSTYRKGQGTANFLNITI